MRPDGSLRPEYYPRGLILSSGEDIPNGQSLRGRMLILEVSPGEVDLDQLTKAQFAAAEGLFAKAMAGFIRWLSPQMESLKKDLPDRHLELRAKTRENGSSHDRTPDMMASLFIGLEIFLRFAMESGAVSKSEGKETLMRGWEALKEAAEAQADHILSEEPAGRFLTLVGAAISSGQAHVADAGNEGRPGAASAWGWRKAELGYGDEWISQGSRIGWVEGDNLYLDPEAAFAAAQKMARDQGSSLPITSRTLWKRLEEKGHLTTTEQGRNTCRQTINGRRKRVLHLFAALLCHKTGPIGPTGPEVAEMPQLKGFGTEKVDRLFDTPQESVPKNGPQTPSIQGSGPIGPKGPEISHRTPAGIESRKEEQFKEWGETLGDLY